MSKNLFNCRLQICDCRLKKLMLWLRTNRPYVNIKKIKELKKSELINLNLK